MTAQTNLECKLIDVSASTEARTFSGYGSIFRNVDYGGDVVLPGAFSKSLREHEDAGTRPLMFYQHDPSKVPGMWTEVREDARGLFVKGTFAKTQLGDEARELLRMGAIDGLSIGFQTVRADYDANGNRRLQELSLREVSIVSMPMNPKAQVSTSSVKRNELAASITDIRQYETLCREIFGLSRTTARRLANKTWPHYTEAVHGEAAAVEITNITDELSAATAIAVLRGAASRIRSL